MDPARDVAGVDRTSLKDNSQESVTLPEESSDYFLPMLDMLERFAHAFDGH